MANLVADYFRAIDLYLLHLIQDPVEQQSYTSTEIVLNKKLKLRGKYEKSVKMTELDFMLQNTEILSRYRVLKICYSFRSIFQR